MTNEASSDAFKGDYSIMDIVIKAKWKPTNSTIIIHIELQNYQQKDFNKRMYHYHCLLYTEHKKAVLPIALLSYDAPGYTEHFNLNISDEEIVRFNYYPVHLKSLYWKDFSDNDNPVTAVLMSHMTYDEHDKLNLKYNFFEILQRLNLSEEDINFLYRFSDVYLPLSKKEVELLMAKLKKDDDTFDLSKLPDSFVEYGKSVGRKEGLKEGMKKGMKEGKKEGKKEGWAENNIQIAKRMLDKGLSIDLIMEITELTKDKIREIESNL